MDGGGGNNGLACKTPASAYIDDKPMIPRAAHLTMAQGEGGIPSLRAEDPVKACRHHDVSMFHREGLRGPSTDRLRPPRPAPPPATCRHHDHRSSATKGQCRPDLQSIIRPASQHSCPTGSPSEWTLRYTRSRHAPCPALVYPTASLGPRVRWLSAVPSKPRAHCPAPVRWQP
jgi:hypothetical protein